ncbi:hypothetical protein JB92DRAFT_2996681 [Gautieria morchelliformis]|nr:hypothetical protein JB92DRAFT_2996681 [Gautieria morchelliformis]
MGALTAWETQKPSAAPSETGWCRVLRLPAIRAESRTCGCAMLERAYDGSFEAILFSRFTGTDRCLEVRSHD